VLHAREDARGGLDGRELGRVLVGAPRQDGRLLALATKRPGTSAPRRRAISPSTHPSVSPSEASGTTSPATVAKAHDGKSSRGSRVLTDTRWLTGKMEGIGAAGVDHATTVLEVPRSMPTINDVSVILVGRLRHER
jgi:hypothetical protein